MKRVSTQKQNLYYNPHEDPFNENKEDDHTYFRRIDDVSADENILHVGDGDNDLVLHLE